MERKLKTGLRGRTISSEVSKINVSPQCFSDIDTGSLLRNEGGSRRRERGEKLKGREKRFLSVIYKTVFFLIEILLTVLS